MDTILATNVLFFVLSGCIILITALAVAFLVVLILAFWRVKIFFEGLKIELEKIADDISKARGKIKSAGETAASFIVRGASLFKKRSKKS